MKIVGCDLHTRYQQIAMLEEETGELTERRLEHESGEARAFYASLQGPVARLFAFFAKGGVVHLLQSHASGKANLGDASHFSRATTNSGAHNNARLISLSGKLQMAFRASSAYSPARSLAASSDP